MAVNYWLPTHAQVESAFPSLESDWPCHCFNQVNIAENINDCSGLKLWRELATCFSSLEIRCQIRRLTTQKPTCYEDHSYHNTVHTQCSEPGYPHPHHKARYPIQLVQYISIYLYMYIFFLTMAGFIASFSSFDRLYMCLFVFFL